MKTILIADSISAGENWIRETGVSNKDIQIISALMDTCAVRGKTFTDERIIFTGYRSPEKYKLLNNILACYITTSNKAKVKFYL